MPAKRTFKAKRKAGPEASPRGKHNLNSRPSFANRHIKEPKKAKLSFEATESEVLDEANAELPFVQGLKRLIPKSSQPFKQTRSTVVSKPPLAQSESSLCAPRASQYLSLVIPTGETDPKTGQVVQSLKNFNFCYSTQVKL